MRMLSLVVALALLACAGRADAFGVRRPVPVRAYYVPVPVAVPLAVPGLVPVVPAEEPTFVEVPAGPLVLPPTRVPLALPPAAVPVPVLPAPAPASPAPPSSGPLPAERVSRYAFAPEVNVYPVARRAGSTLTAGRYRVHFWNHTGATLSLDVDGLRHSVAAGGSLRLDTPADFRWAIAGRAERVQSVPDGAEGLEVVVRR